MRDDEKIGFLGAASGLTMLPKILSMTGGQLFTLTATIFLIVFGGSAIYSLGFFISLPWSITSLVDHSTIAYMGLQLSLMAIIAVASQRCSKLIICGVLIYCNFLLCKFYLAPKRSGGLRHPSVARRQRMMNLEVVEGRRYERVSFVFQTLSIILVMYFFFFKIEDSVVEVNLWRAIAFLSIPILAAMGLFGTLAARRVSVKMTHREFLALPLGRSTAVATVSFFLLFLGMLRAYAMMQGPTVNYISTSGICRLAPIVPLYDGKLFYERASRNFVFVSDGRIQIYSSSFGERQAPTCI